ncbi:MAG: hypothetical protein WCE94_12830 [Candidatus Methanoperedens sp.]
MEKSDGCFRTLRIVGTALAITPIIAALPKFFVNLIIGEPFKLSEEYGVASSLMITAGFILILYGSVGKFKEGYRESLAEERGK